MRNNFLKKENLFKKPGAVLALCISVLMVFTGRGRLLLLLPPVVIKAFLFYEITKKIRLAFVMSFVGNFVLAIYFIVALPFIMALVFGKASSDELLYLILLGSLFIETLTLHSIFKYPVTKLFFLGTVSNIVTVILGVLIFTIFPVK